MTRSKSKDKAKVKEEVTVGIVTEEVETKEPRKVYITGCAKSGTTLLRRLFHAYDPKDVEVIDYEVSPEQFANYTSEHTPRVIVGKRWGTTVFTMDLNREIIERQLQILDNCKAIIINVYRDGRDVIIEDNNWVSPERWMDTIDQMKIYGDKIDYNLQFEKLVRTPNKIQKDIEEILNISTDTEWNSYPTFFRHSDDLSRANQAVYKPRPIDVSEIGKGRKLFTERLSRKGIQTAFLDKLKNLGYIPDNEKLQKLQMEAEEKAREGKNEIYS